MTGDHDRFMALAVEEARGGLRAGERPFGSVVVRHGEVIGRGRNLVNSTKDPTAHAETLAIRDAAKNLSDSRLAGCIVYTTCEPCPMCCGAILWAGIDTLVIGTRYTSIRQLSNGLFDLRDYTVDRLVALTGFKLNIVSGVMAAECDAIYRDWPGWAGYPRPGGIHGRAD
ncbi:MAG: nucleoside deaminase [Candidatus Rokubacteria bacterium]|nr:nucleoside deaminase [Candidatus Rokubacteria bacterium]